MLDILTVTAERGVRSMMAHHLCHMSGREVLAFAFLVAVLGCWIDNAWIRAVEGSLVIVNQSGRDVQVDCGELKGTISNGERAVTAEVKDNIERFDNVLEWFRSNVLGEFFKPPTTCRLEVGTCYVVWHPADYDWKGLSCQGRFEWEVDEIGLLLPFSVSTSVGNEYAMLWQKSNERYSSVANCMNDRKQFRLADAFYSLLFFYPE